MVGAGLSEQRNLRSGDVPWDDKAWQLPSADPLPGRRVDVAILGAGIMGSILAERLSASGRSVALLDRRPPGCGSTAASTAEVMWAMDVPLLHLADRIGEEAAARRWLRVYRAVQGLSQRIDALGVDGAKVERPTVYLAGDLLDQKQLRQEAELHIRHGLPSSFLDPGQTAARFEIAPRAAIVSDGGFEIDPVRLSHALLELARGRGATLSYPINVTSLLQTGEGVKLTADRGLTLEAGDVIVATGYERAPLLLPDAFSLLSTFVIATPPGTAPLWRDNAMIWEASDPYLYLRTDRDGRVIAGGEDIDQADDRVRDALLPAKAGAIAAKLEALLGRSVRIDRAWAATFGASPDGLPAIGRSSLLPHVWLSAGYGGNGLAFAALAAELLEQALAGEQDADAAAFDPYRFEAHEGEERKTAS